MAITYQGGNDAVITGAFAPLMQTLQRNYLFEQEQRNQQAKQAAELQKQIQKDLSQVNANGLRKADLPAFTKEYSGVKDSYYKFLTAKTPEERSMYAMQTNEGMSNLNTLLATSREYGKLYSNSLNGLKDLVGKGKVDQARERVLALADRPSSELTREAFDISDLYDTYNSNKANTDISKGIESAFKNSTNVTTETIYGDIRDLGGGRRERPAVDRFILNEGVPLDVVSKLYQTNTDVKGLVDDVMTEQGVDLNTALAQVASLHEGEFVKETRRNVNPDKGSNTTVINLGSNEQEIQRTIVPEFDIALRPNGTRVKLNNYIPLDQPQSIGGVIRGHNPLTNEQEVLQGNHRAKVLGAGINNSGAELLLIAVPDPDYPDEERVLTVNKDNYLNRVNLSKREADYIKVWEDRFGRGNRTPQNNSVPSQSTSKPKFN